MVSQYLLNILSNPKLSNITIATYHNLAGRDVSGSILKGEKNSFETHSTYLPFILLNRIFDNDIDTIIITKSEEFYSYEFFDQDHKLKLVYVINWSKYSAKLNVDWQDNKSLNMVISYFSKNLYDIADKDGELLLERYIRDIEDDLWFNPYSVTLISKK